MAGLPASAVGGGFNSVSDRVAHHMQERLKRSVLNPAVDASLLADHHDLDLPLFDSPGIVNRARQAVEEPANGDDPQRLKRIPELSRETNQRIATVGHRAGGRLRRPDQDGQVICLFGQATKLTGQVRLEVDRRAYLPALSRQTALM